MLPFIKFEITKYGILRRPYELVAHGGPPASNSHTGQPSNIIAGEESIDVVRGSELSGHGECEKWLI